MHRSTDATNAARMQYGAHLTKSKHSTRNLEAQHLPVQITLQHGGIVVAGGTLLAAGAPWVSIGVSFQSMSAGRFASTQKARQFLRHKEK